MGDDDPRDRYADIKQEYEQAGQDEQDGQDKQPATTGHDSQEGQDSGENQDSQDSQDRTESHSDTDQEGQSEQTDVSGSIKAERPMMQAYIPADEKDELDTAFRQIKALCNLADQEEPMKNDFYAAALRHGYTDLAAVAEYLDLTDAYDEYGEMVT